MNSFDAFSLYGDQLLTLTSNQESHSLQKLPSIKFLFDACILKIGLLSSVKTGAKTSLVASCKDCEYQHSLHTFSLLLGLLLKSSVFLSKL
jgi:hypothetical protein